MPLSFALSVAANERGEFQLLPLPEDRYKVSVTSNVEDISRIDEYNEKTSQHSWVAMRTLSMGAWSELNSQKPLPNTIPIRAVVPQQEWELMAAVQSTRARISAIEPLPSVPTLAAARHLESESYLVGVSEN